MHDREEWWPEFLYRYRSMASARAREDVERVLAHGQIRFSSPSWSNDPFDCQVQPSLDASDTDKQKWLGSFVERKFPHLDSAERRQKVEEIWPRRDAMASGALTEMFEKHIPRDGVLSLSEIPDDILMWSHYADGHRGICLKFRHSCGFFAEAQYVRYSDAYPRVNLFTSTEPEQVDACLLTKSSHWNYEREWRVIKPSPLNGFAHGWYQLPAGSLAGIIFGCATPREDEDQIREWLWLASFQVPLFRARTKEREFALEIEQIS